MKMISRRVLFLILAIAAVGLLCVVLLQPNDSRPIATRIEATSARSTIAPLPASPGAVNEPRTFTDEEAAVATAPVADRPRFVSGGAPAQKQAGKNDVVLQHAQQGLRDYRLAFHQNPVGTNVEITKKLLGKNSRGTRYLPDNAPVNSKGELIDRWNQPLFFHQISANEMEVRSAGPDHIMWTADDEVLR